MTRPRPGEQLNRGRLPVHARDRRPALAALALLLVVAGGLGAALVVYRSGQKTDVLVAAHEIKVGTQVSSDDFRIARVSTDSGLVIDASRENEFLGDYARTEIPGDTLVSPQMFQTGDIIPANGVVVGVSVAQNLRPAESISAGDVVRAFLAPKSDSSTPTDSVLVPAARVVEVSGDTSSSGTLVVSLLVTADEAPALVLGSGQGTVGLALLPPNTKPDIDFQHSS